MFNLFQTSKSLLLSSNPSGVWGVLVIYLLSPVPFLPCYIHYCLVQFSGMYWYSVIFKFILVIFQNVSSILTLPSWSYFKYIVIFHLHANLYWSIDGLNRLDIKEVILIFIRVLQFLPKQVLFDMVQTWVIVLKFLPLQSSLWLLINLYPSVHFYGCPGFY